MKRISTIMALAVACFTAGCDAADNDPATNTQNDTPSFYQDAHDRSTAFDTDRAQRILVLFQTPQEIHEDLTVDRSVTAQGTVFRVTVTQTVDNGYGLALTLRILQDTEGHSYYLGYETATTHAAMDWTVKGFSLSSGKTAYEYRFTASGCLTLSIDGGEQASLQAPMTVEGNYHALTHEATFCINMLNPSVN